jgi:hypothetical protein
MINIQPLSWLEQKAGCGYFASTPLGAAGVAQKLQVLSVASGKPVPAAHHSSGSTIPQCMILFRVQLS